MRKNWTAMPDPVKSIAAGDLSALDVETLGAWVEAQRWYASKSRQVTGVELSESIVLTDEPPVLVLALLQTRFATGTHELYQLPLGIAASDQVPKEDAIIADRAWAVYDALARPEHGRELLRKLEAGLNPELELLRFLSARDFPNIAPLYGWYDYDGHALAATLGVAQEFIPDGVGGWELALDEIESDPDGFLAKLASLGEVTAQMHTVLASDAGDPAFSPEEPSHEALSLLTATVDEDIERIFTRLPDDEAVAPIAGSGQDVRERLGQLAQLGVGGRVVRTPRGYHP